ncbi:DUF4274 domain-containing protein [Stenotrophomonas maltophilia]|nr:DUF4274 domain-containing protein [Stenotrophomonas maltophilia]MBA0391382.1 DUF4274 domain-containing protein [Stenotrophomonas maltophilia]MBA0463968.1 DUF4274 domain-containing protein [Stenotrophomonas maltophilia]MBA0472545.1 DUF4274 domain-containing protein [Stenotrophomonas maltophilia]
MKGRGTARLQATLSHERSPLTPDEYDRASCVLLQDYLLQASPEQRHIYVARRNYDDSPELLAWLAERSELDCATALMMYWSLGAAWFTQYATDGDVPAHERDAHAIVRRIEQHYIEGFYAGRAIAFDPGNWPGPSMGNHPGLVVRRPVPDAMLAAVAGERTCDPFAEAVDAAFDDGLPLALAAQLHAMAVAVQPDRGPALGDAVAGDVDIWAEVMPPTLSPLVTTADPGWPVLETFLRQASPQECHQLMLFADTNALSDALQWLLDQSTLAASSALALYWNLGASWYVPFATIEDVPESYRYTAVVLRRIEQRLADDAYADHGLGFDLARNRPRFPACWPGREVLRAIPDPMWQRRPGQIVEESDDVDFITGLPEDIAEALANARG